MRRRCISWNGPLAWSVQEAEMEGQMQGSYGVVVTCMHERRRQRRLLDYVTPSVPIVGRRYALVRCRFFGTMCG